jgi:hypothetical protein
LLLALALLPGLAAAEDPATTLVARSLGATPILEDLRVLTDEIGGRPTGSGALEQAVLWGVERFKAAGLENVHTEAYSAARTWLPLVESGEVLSKHPAWQSAESNRLRVAAMPFSFPTLATGLAADVVDLGAADESAFAAAGNVRGRFVLVHSEPMRSIDDLFKEYMLTPRIFERAKQAGAAGVLWMSTRPGKLLYRHNVTLNGSLGTLPGAVVEREGALRIARTLAAGRAVQVQLTLTSAITEGAQASNVVAEVRGRERPDEVVILGAHLDAWDLGRGALDNGCNSALVVDVGRQVMALARAGLRPRRTLRFVLYTGEEASMYGSFAEVRSHRVELDRVRAQIIYDEGTGRTSGFSTGGRADIVSGVDAALAAVAALGPFKQTTDAFVGTDNYDYLVEGVPTLVANQDGPPYLPDYHAESDTLDKVDTRELKANTAIAAVLAWGLADREKPLGPRQSRAEVETLTKATGLDEQMKVFGLWDAFASGARGREP